MSYLLKTVFIFVLAGFTFIPLSEAKEREVKVTADPAAVPDFEAQMKSLKAAAEGMIKSKEMIQESAKKAAAERDAKCKPADETEECKKLRAVADNKLRGLEVFEKGMVEHTEALKKFEALSGNVGQFKMETVQDTAVSNSSILPDSSNS